MRTRVLIALLALLVVASIGSIQASASGGKNFSASLTGYEETPTLSVAGTGSFSARLSGDGASISYSLTYSDRTGPALFAHIHLGTPAIAGGVIAFLCGGGGQDTCPGAAGTVTRTIEAANVVGPEGQGSRGVSSRSSSRRCSSARPM